MDELPTDAFYDLTTPGQVAVSPDGERVAFTATESDPEADERPSSVFVVPADGSRDPHRLTRASGAWNVAWSPDGSKLGVLMARDTDTVLRVGRDRLVEFDREHAGTRDDEEREEHRKGRRTVAADRTRHRREGGVGVG